MKIRTYHRPLSFVQAGAEGNRKLARWWSVLAEFNFKLEYLAGKSNLVADCLSRLTNCEDYQKQESFETKLEQEFSLAFSA